MNRDDTVRDRHDVVLSPCGWREGLLPHVRDDDPEFYEQIRDIAVNSPFFQQGYDRVVSIRFTGSETDRRPVRGGLTGALQAGLDAPDRFRYQADG